MTDELYVDIANPSKENLQKGKKTGITRRALPKIDKMLEWGIVKEGDIIVAKGTTEEALLQKDGKMQLSDGRVVSMQQWLKDVFGWSSVQTYICLCRIKRKRKNAVSAKGRVYEQQLR